MRKYSNNSNTITMIYHQHSDLSQFCQAASNAHSVSEPGSKFTDKEVFAAAINQKRELK